VQAHSTGEKVKMSEIMDGAKGLTLAVERWCNGGE